MVKIFEHIWDEDEREKRTKKEVRRLVRIFQVLDEDRKATADGLIKNAAFQRVMLDELVLIIKRDGYIEEYSNGGGQTGFKKSSAVEIYDKTLGTYGKNIKMLCDMLPEDKAGPGVELMNYLKTR